MTTSALAQHMQGQTGGGMPSGDGSQGQAGSGGPSDVEDAEFEVKKERSGTLGKRRRPRGSDRPPRTPAFFMRGRSDARRSRRKARREGHHPEAAPIAGLFSSR